MQSYGPLTMRSALSAQAAGMLNVSGSVRSAPLHGRTGLNRHASGHAESDRSLAAKDWRKGALAQA